MDAVRQLGTLSLIARLSKLAIRLTPESALGIPLRHYYVLSSISMPTGGSPAEAGITQRQLGETMMMDPNNIVLLLNELEAEGLVRRERDPADRRRHLVRLTEEGEAKLEAAIVAREVVEDEILAGLSAEERRTLHELLSRVLET